MRSHMLKFYAEERASKKSLNSYSTSLSEEEDEEQREVVYGLRENPFAEDRNGSGKQESRTLTCLW